jgi:hypothetical protein
MPAEILSGYGSDCVDRYHDLLQYRWGHGRLPLAMTELPVLLVSFAESISR